MTEEEHKTVSDFVGILLRKNGAEKLQHSPHAAGWLIEETASRATDVHVLQNLAQLENASVDLLLYANPNCPKKIRKAIRRRIGEDKTYAEQRLFGILGVDYANGELSDTEYKKVLDEYKYLSIESTRYLASRYSFEPKLVSFLWKYFKKMDTLCFILDQRNTFQQCSAETLEEMFNYLCRRSRVNRDSTLAKFLMFPNCPQELAIRIVKQIYNTKNNCIVRTCIAESPALTETLKIAILAAKELQ